MFLGYALPWEREATEITLGLDGGGSFAREQDGAAEQIQMGSSGSTFTPINQPLTPGCSPDERADANEEENDPASSYGAATSSAGSHSSGS